MKVFQSAVKDRGVVTKPAFFTHLGPVISEPDLAAGIAYVGASPYLDQTGLYEQFDRMNRAANVEELNEALSLHQYN